MNTLIVEDEKASARSLQTLIRETDASAVIVAITESIAATVDYLRNNKAPELILMDIRLADGISFEIFRQVQVTAPVIFITAYDEYMQSAFKVNSIDYLLKPIDKEELKAAFLKYHSLYPYPIPDDMLQEKLFRILEQYGATGAINYKTRFLVKERNNLLTIPVDETAWLHAEGRIVFLHTLSGKKYFIEDSLDHLEKILNPTVFFRINRSYIAPISSIDKVEKHFKGKLWVSLKQSTDKDIFVSREKAAAFREWLGR